MKFHVNAGVFIVIGAAAILIWFFYGFYKMESFQNNNADGTVDTSSISGQ